MWKSPQIRLPLEQTRQWVSAILQAAGLKADHGRDVAEVFIRASLREIGHHDLSFLPQRLDWIAHEGVNPRPELRRTRGAGGIETWDGDQGLGEICCTHITRRALELAKNYGIGYAAVRASNHFLAASPYAEMGIEAGALVLVFSNTDAGMASVPGQRNTIGNNPLGIGVPRSEGPPVILDMCMAYSSLGNLAALERTEAEVPPYWGNDAEGRPSVDPGSILHGGSVNPIAGHKGFGLALMVEVLTGLLSDGTTGNQVLPGGGVNTHNQSVIAFDLGFFGSRESVAQRMEDLVRRLKTTQPGLRIPGERSQMARGDSKEHGIPLSEAIYKDLVGRATVMGVSDVLTPRPIVS